MQKLLSIILCLLFSITIIKGQTNKLRPLGELINTKESAWTDFLQQWIKEAKNPVEVLPKEERKADSTLYKTQVTTRSPMGAIVYETGGLLIDKGWIRILGSGSKKLNRNLMDWNKGKAPLKPNGQPPYLLIADDIIGGFFAINAGGIDTLDLGKIFYFAPDNLLWTSTGMTYTQFLFFCFSGDIKKFYSNLYWVDWEKDIKLIDGNQGVYCFPYLCTVEGKDINKVKRETVSIEKLWNLENDIRKQFVIEQKKR